MRAACLRLLGISVLSLLSSSQGVAHFRETKAPFLRTSGKSNATASVKTNDSVSTTRGRSDEKGMKCVHGVCCMSRGGSIEDEYDDEYDDDYDEERPPPPPSRNRPPPRSRRAQPTKQSPPSAGRGPPPARRGPSSSRRRRPPPPRRRSPSVLSSVTGLAKKTADLTATATVSTLKGSGKAAFYLVSPKYVTRREVWGVWRLDQELNSDSDAPISCAANVEFTPRGDVLVMYQDETYETTYLFRERSWPRSCTIEFEARAFQGPHDEEPVLMRYKGFFRRKLVDSDVIKIVGYVCEVPRRKKGGMWGGGGGGRKGRKVGTFVARRRIVKRERREKEQEQQQQSDEENDVVEEFDEDEIFDEDEYDGYDQ